MRTPREPAVAPSLQTSAEKAQGRPGRAKSRHTPELEAALGARIRAARVAARMSQKELAAAVGVSFQQLQKYELGKDRVAASTLHGLAAALGLHPGSFFDDNDTPMPAAELPELRAVLKIAEAVARVRDPGVLRRLVALAEALAEPKPPHDATEG